MIQQYLADRVVIPVYMRLHVLLHALRYLGERLLVGLGYPEDVGVISVYPPLDSVGRPFGVMPVVLAIPHGLHERYRVVIHLVVHEKYHVG